jgi:hypothetical protein
VCVSVRVCTPLYRLNGLTDFIHIRYFKSSSVVDDGHAVAYLVEALCNKTEGRGFKSRSGAFINLPNPSSHTIALESTQPLTEMSIRNIPGR